MESRGDALRVGLVSTRLSGVDGVTLEAFKVKQVLEEAGHEIVSFAGLLEERFLPGVEYPPAHFEDPDNMALQAETFGSSTRPDWVSGQLRRSTDDLNNRLRAWVDEFHVDVILPENALSIPLQLPLALAIAELVLETGIHCVAHHHDMVWERERFWPNAVPDVIGAAFPPPGHQFTHMAISSRQCEEISRRVGQPVTLIPNVMDFQNEPAPGDGAAFRAYAGIHERDILLLQPTRIVPRKNIETTIDLAERLGDPTVRVVVTHPNEDEVKDYWPFLMEHAERRGVDFRLAPINTPDSPSLADAYAAADLVCYPSLIEGFGNALVETMLYRRPLVVNRYPVYNRDIAPTGVRFIEFDRLITNEVLDAVSRCLADPGSYAEALDDNYQVGREQFSYEVLRERMLPLFSRLG